MNPNDNTNLDPNRYISQIIPVFNVIGGAAGIDQNTLNQNKLNEIAAYFDPATGGAAFDTGSFNNIKSYTQGYINVADPVYITGGLFAVNQDFIKEGYVCDINGNINISGNMNATGDININSLNANTIKVTTSSNGSPGSVGADNIAVKQILFSNTGIETSLTTSNGLLYYGSNNLTGIIELKSTVTGLGSAGYVSSFDKTISTVTGLGTVGYISSFDKMISTIEGLGSIYLSTATGGGGGGGDGVSPSTVEGLGSVYISSLGNNFPSTVNGLGSLYVSTAALSSTIFGINSYIDSNITILINSGFSSNAASNIANGSLYFGNGTSNSGLLELNNNNFTFGGGISNVLIPNASVSNISASNLTFNDTSGGSSGLISLTNGTLSVGGSISNISISNITSSNITSSNIASSNITSSNITSSNITSSNITSSNITSSNITSSNITSSNITSSNITSSNITSSNITSSNITSSNITSSNITSSNITSSNITSSNITSSNITSSNITSSNITSSNITSSNITSSNLTFNDTSGGTSGSLSLTSGTLTLAGSISNLGVSNITSSNITSSNITSSNITSSNITSSNITSSNITSSNMTSSNITSSNIYASNVYSSNITCCNLTSSNITSSNLTLSDQSGSSGLITLTNGIIDLGGNIVGLNMPGTIYFRPYTVTPCNKLVFFERGNSILFYSGIDLIDLNGSVRYTVTSSSVPIFGYHTFGITTFSTYYEWMRITGTDTGNNNTKVGIACNNPAYTLDIGGDINCSGAFRVNGVALTTGGGGITNIAGIIDCTTGSLSNVTTIYFTPFTVGKKLVFFQTGPNTAGLNLYDINGSISYSVTYANSTYGFHTFGITNANIFFEWMRITGNVSGGAKVGIACNSPQYGLDVNGDINCSGSLRINGLPITGGGIANVAGIIDCTNGSLSNVNSILFTPFTVGKKLVFFQNGPNSTAGINLYDTNGSISYSASYFGSIRGIHTFGISVVGNFYEWMRIQSAPDSSGRVGIANPNPQYALDVGGDINCSGSLRVNGIPVSGGIANVAGIINCTNGSLSNVNNIYSLGTIYSRGILMDAGSGNGNIDMNNQYIFNCIGINMTGTATSTGIRMNGTLVMNNSSIISCGNITFTSSAYTLNTSGGTINMGGGSINMGGGSINGSANISMQSSSSILSMTGGRINMTNGTINMGGGTINMAGGGINTCGTITMDGASYSLNMLGSRINMSAGDISMGTGSINTCGTINIASSAYALNMSGGNINTTGGGINMSGGSINMQGGTIDMVGGAIGNCQRLEMKSGGTGIYMLNTSIIGCGNINIASSAFSINMTGGSIIMSGGNIGSAGTISATSFINTSDSNIKTNIQDARNYINDISKLRVVTFDYLSKYGGSNNIGLIAQEVREIFPELVGSNEEGILNINYSGLTSIILSGVQVTQSSLTGYKTALESLEEKYQKQQAQIDFLLSTVSKLTKV